MFIGEYHHSVDDKGRVAIPMKFREDLSQGAVVSKGLDKCLFLFTAEEWQKWAKKIALSPTQADSRAFSRLMLSGAMDLEIDKQGRVVLPDYLRKYANLKKSVVIAGLYSRLEIWDEGGWEQYKQNTEKESNEIAERLAQLGI